LNRLYIYNYIPTDVAIFYTFSVIRGYRVCVISTSFTDILNVLFYCLISVCNSALHYLIQSQFVCVVYDWMIPSTLPILVQHLLQALPYIWEFMYYYVHILWPCNSFQPVDGYSRKHGYSAARDFPIIALLSLSNASNTVVLTH
jgi:hypothetical protein